MTIRRWGDEILSEFYYANPWGTISAGFESLKTYESAGLTNGNFVVVGIDTSTSPDRGYFQIYDGNGAPIGGLTQVGTGSAAVREVSVTALSNGNFAIVYTIGDSDQTDIEFEIRSPTGSFIDRDSVENGPSDEENDIAIDSFDGGFVVSYSNDSDVRAQVWNNDGSPATGINQIRAGAGGTDEQYFVDTAVSRDSDTAAFVWADEDDDNLYFQTRNTSDLLARSGLVTLDSTFGPSYPPKIAAIGSNAFAIVWTDNNVDGSSDGIFMAIRSESGSLIAGTRRVNLEGAGSQRYPDIIGLADGNVMMAWQDVSDGTSKIVARIFDQTGNPVGREYRIDLDGDGDRYIPKLSVMEDGRVVVAYADTTRIGENVTLQIVDPRDGYMDGDESNNEIYGHAAVNDQITGFGGEDRLLGLGGDDSLYGGDDDDTLFGNNGDDEMYGGDQNDTLVGGRGADLHDGGSGSDTAYYLDATEGLRASLTTEAINTGWAMGDVYRSIENLTGTNFDDDLYGTAGGAANVIRGGAGDDLIRGYSGDDTLYGNADDDILDGGLGADVLSGSTGYDTATYASAGSGVTASLANSLVNTGEADGDTYFSIEKLEGSRFNDILNGDNSDNEIVGGAGNDFVRGYRGMDTLTGGSGVDRFVFSHTLGAASLHDITDFQVGTDKIRLFDSVFSALSPGGLSASEFRINSTGQAQDGTDHIIYNQSNGYLYYDSDGIGGAGRVYFARLDDGLSLSISDFEVV